MTVGEAQTVPGQASTALPVTSPAAVTSAGVTAGAAATPPGGQRRSGGGRSIPFRLGAWSAVLTTCIALLLAVAAASVTATRAGAATVASRSAEASTAANLYFALADLDAQAARLVLLGGGVPPGATTAQYGADQLSALGAFNSRTAQIDTYLAQLAAGGRQNDPNDVAAVAALAQNIDVYQQIAAAAVAMDDSADQNAGAPAGRPLTGAVGYYSRATGIMQGQILPAAHALSQEKAAELANAAGSAADAGNLGGAATAAAGLLATAAALLMHRRTAVWFRRLLNVGLAVAALSCLALGAGGALALTGSAAQNSAAGSRFAGYLAVVQVQTDSYNADGAAVRFLVLPGIGAQATESLTAQVGTELAGLGDDPAAQQAVARWSRVAGPGGDIPGVIADFGHGDVIGALALDTGIKRGNEDFDFSYYNLALDQLAQQRLDAFQAASAADSADLADWPWLPWVLAAAAFAGLVLGVRPRFAEYR